MRKRNWNRKFGIQRLEDRRLLAADVAVDLTFVETAEPEICEVQSLDSQTESESTGEAEADNSTGVELDLDSTEIAIDNLESVDSPAAESNEAATEEIESSVQDLGDPVDGTDGFFGSIDAENPSQQFNISPSEDGLVDIVIASSFGESETRLSVTDSSGDIVVSAAVEELEGFKQLSFEGDAGENYLLTVSSEQGTEGQFQLTVGHSETPEPVDQHADTIGESSTELTFSDGTSTLDGDIETAGDIDTFRFTADADGRASLGLAELNADNATELSVQVFDSQGEQISRGITNESVGISFDVEAGAEYFISVNAAEGETGSYRIDLSVEPTAIAPTDAESSDAEPSDTESTDAEPSSEDTSSDSEVDENTADEPVEEPTVVDETDEEPAGETEPEIVDDLTDETTLIEDSEDETTGDTELVADTETESPGDNTELVADPTEESDLAPVDEADIDPVVVETEVEAETEADADVEIVDSTDDLTADADATNEVAAETGDADQSVEVEVVDNLDTSDGEATETVDEELATSDDPTSVSDAETEAAIDPVVALDPIGEGDINDALIGCDPIPVDVIDSESTETVATADESSNEPEVEVTEVVDSVPENTTTDLAESFEPSETDTEESEPAAQIDVAETVENLIDTVLDAADHAEALDDLIDGGFDGLFGDADVAVAEQAVDSFFSDADLVEELISL